MTLQFLNRFSAGSLISNGHAAVAGAAGVFRHVAKALEIRRQRNALLSLDDRMLSDIGIGRGEAWHEASRPLLDVPEQRRRGRSSR